MKKIHCEPHEMGIAFEYEPCIARLKKRPWLLGLRAFFA